MEDGIMCRSPDARPKLVVYEPRGRACFSPTVNVVPHHSPLAGCDFIHKSVASILKKLYLETVLIMSTCCRIR